jgi:phosphotransferase system IIB component
MGRGKLSEDLRSCADRLHQLVKKHYYLQDRKEIKSELGYSRVGANNT